MRTIVLLMAAGAGTRMGSAIPKQYKKLNGVSIINFSIERFLQNSQIHKVVVVIRDEHKDLFNEAIKNYDSDITFVLGGQTRKQSVYNGLAAIEKFNPTHVLIHDVARPFVSDTIINEVIEKLKHFDAVDVALPVNDTIKNFKNLKVNIAREDFYLTQTPQGFEYDLIRRLHKQYFNQHFTDDIGMAIEFGIEIGFVQGERNNFKITYPEDINYAA